MSVYKQNKRNLQWSSDIWSYTLKKLYELLTVIKKAHQSLNSLMNWANKIKQCFLERKWAGKKTNGRLRGRGWVCFSHVTKNVCAPMPRWLLSRINTHSHMKKCAIAYLQLIPLNRVVFRLTCLKGKSLLYRTVFAFKLLLANALN